MMEKIYYDKNTSRLIYQEDKITEDSGYIEVENSNDYYAYEYGKCYKVINGKIELVDDEEIVNTSDYKKYKLIVEKSTLETYLNETDYIISKLNELKLEDEDEYNTERQKYVEQLAKRKEARSRINEIEKELEEI